MNYQTQKKTDIIDRIEYLEECLRIKNINKLLRQTKAHKEHAIDWLAEDLVEYLDYLEVDVPDFADYMNQVHEENERL